MGYGKRGEITTFWPDNSATELWLESGYSMTIPEMIEKIKEHFGTDDLSLFEISAEYVHTDCLYYDKYDPNDYTKFIRITRKN